MAGYGPPVLADGAATGTVAFLDMCMCVVSELVHVGGDLLVTEP